MLADGARCWPVLRGLRAPHLHVRLLARLQLYPWLYCGKHSSHRRQCNAPQYEPAPPCPRDQSGCSGVGSDDTGAECSVTHYSCSHLVAAKSTASAASAGPGSVPPHVKSRRNCAASRHDQASAVWVCWLAGWQGRAVGACDGEVAPPHRSRTGRRPCNHQRPVLCMLPQMRVSKVRLESPVSHENTARAHGCVGNWQQNVSGHLPGRAAALIPVPARCFHLK